MNDGSANPFVGLRPYRSDESLLFFGRRQQTTELLTELYKTHFLGVVGSSGCGKSSLIQAGLIPRLTAGFLVENRDLWMFRTLTPGGAPRARLAAAFDLDERALIEEGATAIVEWLAAQPDALSRNCLLLVDQFEEIFSFIDSIAQRDEAADFVAILLSLAAQREFPLFVVLTMRSDFLGDCDVFYGLPEAINQSHYLVPRLTRASRQEVIDGPVRLYGQAITPQLVDRVLNDLGDNQDQLPVMQHALLRTWECWQRTGAQGPIDLSHYVSVGGANEALSRDADDALKDASEAERRLAVLVFQALTDTDPNNRPVRRYVRMSALERETGASRDAVQRIVERFRESGRSFLIVRKDPGSDDPTIHISHESLIRQWGKLAEWVEEERQSRDQYLRLVDLAQRHARGQEGLLRDPALQLTLDWRKRTAPTETWARRYRDDFGLAMAFLDASEAQREKDRLEGAERHLLQLDLAEERGRARARARLLWVAGALVVVAFILAGVAGQQSQHARSQTAVANSTSLAIHARTHADRDLPLAMLLGVEAFKTAPTFEAWSGLLTLIGGRPHLYTFLHGHDKTVRSVAFAPGGKRAASAGDDGKVRLWNVETGQQVHDFPIEPDWFPALAFSPDGLLLAAGGGNGPVIVWNAALPKEKLRLESPKDGIRSIAFSPDGNRLAAGARDATVVVWQHLRNGADGEGAKAVESFTLTAGDADSKNDVQSVAFADNGVLASAHLDGSVFLWDVERRKITHELPAGDAVNSVAFGPGGRFLVSGSDGRTVVVWDLADRNAPPLRLAGHQARVQSVAVSRDGTLIATGSDDKTIRLWDVVAGADGTHLQVRARPVPLVGHGSQVQAVAFDPAGTRLISGGLDNKVILWDLARESLLDTRYRDPEKTAIEALSWAPDGQSVASIRTDLRIARWRPGADTSELVQKRDASKGRAVALTFEPDGQLAWSGVRGNEFTRQRADNQQTIGNPAELPDGEDTLAIAISADRRLLAYAARSNEIVLWNLAERRKQAAFPTEKWVDSLAFSPDGAMLAASWLGAVVLWDLANGQELDRLTDHDLTDSAASTAFSPDGRRLAVSGQTRIFVWDVEKRQLSGVLLTAHESPIRSLAFSPDGERLASGDGVGTIRVWNLSADAVQRAACRAANTELPDRERALIAGDGNARAKTCGN